MYYETYVRLLVHSKVDIPRCVVFPGGRRSWCLYWSFEVLKKVAQGVRLQYMEEGSSLCMFEELT